jgi:hypothetical protein
MVGGQFPTSSHGYDPDQVEELLAEQMRLALGDPRAALAELASVELRRTRPGLDAEHVDRWIDAQRTWLAQRCAPSEAAVPDDIGSALEQVSAALELVAAAVSRDAGEAERRIVFMLAAAERRCADLVRDAEDRLVKRSTEERLAAQQDAERLLERAAASAGRTVAAAEEQLKVAQEVAATAEALRGQLLQAIDLAQSSVQRLGPETPPQEGSRDASQDKPLSGGCEDEAAA